MIRILMVSRYPLFSQGIERLLSHDTGLEIVGCEKDLERAAERIVDLRPDIVILDSTEPVWNAAATLMRILRDKRVTKVIGLNPHDNTICVYREERRTALGVQDLVEVIKEPPIELR